MFNILINIFCTFGETSIRRNVLRPKDFRRNVLDPVPSISFYWKSTVFNISREIRWKCSNNVQTNKRFSMFWPRNFYTYCIFFWIFDSDIYYELNNNWKTWHQSSFQNYPQQLFFFTHTCINLPHKTQNHIMETNAN